MTTQNEPPLLLVKLPHGGFVVKKFDVYNNNSGLLFAGSLSDCLSFIERFFNNVVYIEEEEK